MKWTVLLAAVLAVNVLAQGPEMKLTKEEAKDGAYLLLKAQTLNQKRQEIVGKYQKQLEADTDFQKVQAEIQSVNEEGKKLTDSILTKRKLDPKTHTVNLQLEQIEEIKPPAE